MKTETPDERLAAITRRYRVAKGLRSELSKRESLGETRLHAYANDPLGFISTVLGEFMWSGQREIAESVRDNRYTAVPSAHDLGKSFAASRIVAWWLASHPDAFAVTTAPTFPQVRMILWREIGRAHRKGSLAGRVNQTEWWLADEPIAYGRKPADYDPAAFQGIHARHVLVVIDEAGGVPVDLWNAVDAIVTNEESRVLAIGNPDAASTHFEKVCRPGSGWNVIHLDGLESPNFTKEEVPDELRGLLLSPTWVEERKARWGENSPLYQSKVRGRFPVIAEDALIPAPWVERARERYTETLELLEAEDEKTVEMMDTGHALGVDVARGGGDASVIVDRHGRLARVVWSSSAVADTMQIVAEVLRVFGDTGAERIGIDVVGVGSGVVDRLRQVVPPTNAGRDRIEDLNGGWAATELDELGQARFVNIRSEWWWGVRELFDPEQIARTGEWIGVDPGDDDLAGQLSAMRWTVEGRGRIKVESKDDMKKRGIDSPDLADALMYSIARKPQSVEGYVVTDPREEFQISEL